MCLKKRWLSKQWSVSLSIYYWPEGWSLSQDSFSPVINRFNFRLCTRSFQLLTKDHNSYCWQTTFFFASHGETSVSRWILLLICARPLKAGSPACSVPSTAAPARSSRRWWRTCSASRQRVWHWRRISPWRRRTFTPLWNPTLTDAWGLSTGTKPRCRTFWQQKLETHCPEFRSHV